ncbi:hypothetical protein GCM10020229_50220 [Kitasatospora albolonga]|uniref:hypothetical protein n=1 Tax=Kitasatospora albolonga TaxID=68173 RepID=UPI0031EED505
MSPASRSAAGSCCSARRTGTLLHSTLAFDASTFEIWNALLVGARVVAVPHHPQALHELAAELSRPEVTTAWLTAAVFH